MRTPFVRLEIRLGRTRSFINQVKKNGFESAKISLIRNQLSNLVETPLLDKHQAFITEQTQVVPSEEKKN